MTTRGSNHDELQRLLAAPPPAYTFPTEVILDLDGRELWRGVGPLCRADLRGVDLRRADLRERNLRRARLAGANLHGANLEASDLFMADLTSADLREAELNCCKFGAASMRDADLRGASGWIESVAFELDDFPLDLCGADLRGNFEDYLEDDILGQIYLFDDRTRTTPSRTDSARCPVHVEDWLARARTSRTSHMPIGVVRDRIGRVAWSWPYKLDWKSDAPNLDGEDLSGCDHIRLGMQSNADLSGSVLDGWDFRRTELYASLWQDVRARCADFRATEMVGGTRERCDFRRSTFAGADLSDDSGHSESRWINCDLRDCDFRSANLIGADLRGSRLEGSRFDGACFSPSTRFPDGFDPCDHGFDEGPFDRIAAKDR